VQKYYTESLHTIESCTTKPTHRKGLASLSTLRDYIYITGRSTKDYNTNITAHLRINNQDRFDSKTKYSL